MDTNQVTYVTNGIDWVQALTVFAIVAANLGTVIGLYLHNDKKIECNRVELAELIKTNRQEANEILKGIHDDIKDFHGKLCMIEARGKK